MRLAALLALLALPCLAPAQDAEPPKASPADAIRERTKKDAGKLLPQRGLGGDEKSELIPGKTTFTEVRIEAPGCEKMTGYVSVPDTLDRSKKCALFFMFHGNGDVGKGRVQNHARITSERDPVIVCGVQYQELTPEGGGKMGLPLLAEGEEVFKGCRWLLDKVMKDHPVDSERVFVGGFSMGTGFASGWALREWRDHPESFPFRGVFLYGSGGSGTKAAMPPVIWVSMCGEEETAVLGKINVVESVRHWSNVLAAWGVPVLYHEIPKMGHAVNARCLQITRDLVNDLGGPGAIAYPSADSARPDPLPFPAPTDPHVKEAASLAGEDRWSEAVARIAEVEADRRIALKDKKAVLAFRTEMQKFAQAEIPRLDKLLADAAKAEALPNPFQLRRQKALLEAYAKWPWAQKKSFGETVARLESPDWPPAAREREREQLMRDAWALEPQGKEQRAEAKAVYEKLAGRAAEDGGRSVWPRAAQWRLKWWME